MITDNYIVNNFFIKDKHNNNKINIHALKKITNEEKTYLLNRYCDSDSIKETLRRILWKVEIKPKCPICNKPVKWLGKKNRLMLHTCSLECGIKLRTMHIKETCLIKYGVENCWQSTEKQTIIKQTLIKKYGVDNPTKNETIKNKEQQTCLSRYGHYNFGCSELAKIKTKQTKLLRYNDENFVNIEKIKQTKLLRYNDENFVNMEKYRQTCLKRYGVEYYTQSIEHKKRVPEIKKKIRETLRKNNKLTGSKTETYIYRLLIKKFNNVICQYYCDKYPYNCDFYIPEIDTYIEYQGYYTHDNHPFDKNNIDDIIELNNLKTLNLKHKKVNNNLYNTKIYIWTINDVEKRNIATKNNLKYLEFFEYNEIKKWIDNYDNKNN